MNLNRIDIDIGTPLVYIKIMRISYKSIMRGVNMQFRELSKECLQNQVSAPLNYEENYIMNLTSDTVAILKNFSDINQNILVKLF